MTAPINFATASTVQGTELNAALLQKDSASNTLVLGSGTAMTLAVAGGGTGAATLTANAVLTGNGTSAIGSVAPGTSGNVLTSNGTAWVSQAFTNSLGTNGYTRLPNGMFIQWGEYTASMAHTIQYTATFPIAFPTACLQVIGYAGQTTSTGVTAVYCPEISHNATSYTFQYGTINGATYTTTVHYIAIGY